MAKKVSSNLRPLSFMGDCAGQTNGNPHWQPVWCAKHHFETLARGLSQCPYGCPPGPQMRILWSEALEVLGGGSRGGMKTESGRGYLIKGNMWEPQAHPLDKNGQPQHVMFGGGSEAYCGICVNISYIMHPRYRALILRENEKDLADFISRAKLLYEPMGAVVTEKPARVSWPSKAAFILGHMKDTDAFTDYMGQEFHRMLFEELTQISRELLYLQIIGSCRSTFTCRKGCKHGECQCGALRRQILNTANPGGKGHLWVKKRFISVAKPNEVYTDPLTKLTRVYIPSTVTDNPYLMQDEGYLAWLNGLPEPTRSAWRFGDWDALGGQYFSIFRPKGPLGEEPPEAKHVIHTGEFPLQPWWPRWIGGDWGYKHNFAFYWACQAPNGQIIIHREMTGNEVSSFDLGAQVARACFTDLEGLAKQQQDPKITLWLSPDAFAKRNEELSIAESFVQGIEKVLGPGSAFFPDQWYRVTRETSDWEGNYFTDFKIQRKFGIAIRKAQNQRIFGWQHIRELMRFTQAHQVNPDKYDHGYATKLLHDDPKRYRLYVESFEARKPETLPRLLIDGDACPQIIGALSTAVYKEETEDLLKVDTPEDDCLDALRYCLHSHNVEKNCEPQKSFVERHLAEVREREPNLDYNSIVWAARKAEEDYAALTSSTKPFSFPVEGSRAFKVGRRKRYN